jgi:hypothetical protein
MPYSTANRRNPPSKTSSTSSRHLWKNTLGPRWGSSCASNSDVEDHYSRAFFLSNFRNSAHLYAPPPPQFTCYDPMVILSEEFCAFKIMAETSFCSPFPVTSPCLHLPTHRSCDRALVDPCHCKLCTHHTVRDAITHLFYCDEPEFISLDSDNDGSDDNEAWENNMDPMDLHAITTTLTSLVLAVQQLAVQHETTTSSPPSTTDPVLLPDRDDLHPLSERPDTVATLFNVPSDKEQSNTTVTNPVPTMTTPPMALVNLHTTRDSEQPASIPLLQSAPTFFSHWSSRLTRIVQQTIHARALRSMPPSLPMASHLPISFPNPPFILAQRQRPIQCPQVTDVHAMNDVLVPATQEDIERQC